MTTSDIVKILHARYGGPGLDKARAGYEVAQLIRQVREAAGLSQGELADLMGTSQSVLSRLESEEYDGHSLKSLRRIADALQCQLRVGFEVMGGEE